MPLSPAGHNLLLIVLLEGLCCRGTSRLCIQVHTLSIESMTDIPSARNNNIVAESDVTAAISAMHHRLTTTRIPHQVDADAMPLLLEQCSKSMEANILRILQPYSDDAYQMYLDSFEETEESQSKNDTPRRSELQFTEEELLDQEALKGAKEARQKIREQAAVVKELRESVLNKTVELAQRQVQVWMHCNENIVNSTLSKENLLARLLETQASLESVTKACKTAETELPEKLSNLQQTIETIEESLNKGLSHTEKAIRSREAAVNPAFDRDLAPQERLNSVLRQGY